MDDLNFTEALGQVSASEAGEAGVIFRNFLRGGVRQMICEVMAAEVTELCGPKHHPNDSGNVRAGSSSGRVIAYDQREDIVRPRVRREDESGQQEEVKLASYQAANDPAALTASIIQALASGVRMQKVKPGAPGVSKSNISRLWQQAGPKFVDELRGRDISNQNWVGLMLDGIRLSKDQLAVVALGITAEGFKFVLDFELGTSESAEVSMDTMRRLDKRGFSCERRLFAATDGTVVADDLETLPGQFVSSGLSLLQIVDEQSKTIALSVSQDHFESFTSHQANEVVFVPRHGLCRVAGSLNSVQPTRPRMLTFV